MWKCPSCKELIQDGFDECWNCGTHADGTQNPSFSRDPDAPNAPDQSKDPIAPPSVTVPVRSGIAYSLFADFTLLIGQGCALIGCVCAIIYGVLCMRADDPIGFVLLAPLSFCLALANFVVFSRVRRL